MNDISGNIQNRISSIGKPDKAKWLENYVKHDIKSKGVGIPDIRAIVIKATRDHNLSALEIPEQIDFLNDLMTSEYTEDKLAAILYIQLYWNKINGHEKIALISEWFDKELITDWNVCDWLCVRLLTPMVDDRTEETTKALKKWNTDRNPWKARASLVPFAQSKSLAEHKDILEAFSLELIRRNERFCKTAVGWVLREYSKINPVFVTGFLEENKNWTTKEVLNNALKYIDK